MDALSRSARRGLWPGRRRRGPICRSRARPSSTPAGSMRRSTSTSTASSRLRLVRGRPAGETGQGGARTYHLTHRSGWRDPLAERRLGSRSSTPPIPILGGQAAGRVLGQSRPRQRRCRPRRGSPRCRRWTPRRAEASASTGTRFAPRSACRRAGSAGGGCAGRRMSDAATIRIEAIVSQAERPGPDRRRPSSSATAWASASGQTWPVQLGFRGSIARYPGLRPWDSHRRVPSGRRRERVDEPFGDDRGDVARARPGAGRARRAGLSSARSFAASLTVAAVAGRRCLAAARAHSPARPDGRRAVAGDSASRSIDIDRAYGPPRARVSCRPTIACPGCWRAEVAGHAIALSPAVRSGLDEVVAPEVQERALAIQGGSAN